MRLDIWKKEGILPVLLALAALAAASYYFLFAPEIRAIRGIKEEIARKDRDLAEAMALRAAVEGSRSGGGQRWDVRLRSWEERVPVSPDTDRLLSEIGGQAVRHRLKSFGLTVVQSTAEKAQPPAPPPAEGAAAESGMRLPEVRYRMTFRSTYLDLAEFLDDIPRMRRLLSVRSVSVQGERDSMVSTVEISAWHRGTE
ncbi:MAG: Pilus assembly protein, PilO [Deltaproteobacteria bacterium]|nr:Pilus assembly protein, PilO [Deltaproteobacteria bacterium]